MAYDTLTKRLYVTTDSGAVQIFTLPGLANSGSIAVGTNLKGIDLSPDRSKLAVGSSDSSRVSIISLPGHTVTHYPFTSASGDGGASSVAFLDSRRVAVGSRILDLSTGTYEKVGYSFYGTGIIAANSTRSAIAFTEPGISSGTSGIFDPKSNTNKNIGTGWFTYDVALSPDAKQIVVPTYSGSFVYDLVNGAFSKSATIGTYATWWGRGAAYSPKQPYLFVSFSSSSASASYPGIVAYDRDTFATRGTVDSSWFGSITNSSYSAGHLRISANGRYLFALTSTGVKIHDVSNGKRDITLAASPADGGTVTGSGLVNAGTSVTLAALPNPGWLFTGWTGSSTQSAASFSLVANDDAEFTASFVKDLGDPDGDGLTTFHEMSISLTNPNLADTDLDGRNDNVDRFPKDALEWTDADADGTGDNGDPDDDNDSVPDTSDAFPFDPAAGKDTDGDGKPDELVPGVITTLLEDSDDDNDSYSDAHEIAASSNPKDSLSKPADNDLDLLPDILDPDDDNDQVPDTNDAFPFDPAGNTDTDGDGKPDTLIPSVTTTLVEDLDDDNDGYSDEVELQVGSLPRSAASVPADHEGDFIPDVLDPDDDNDSVLDLADAFPFDAGESADNDRDGSGDNTDRDDDNDGYTDTEDEAPFSPATVSGTYFALLEADPVLTAGHGGTLELTINPKGGVTGRIRLATDVLTFRGSLGPQVGPIAPLMVEVQRRGRTPLQLELQLGAALEGQVSGGAHSTSAKGWKKRYGKGEREIDELGGDYHLALARDSNDRMRAAETEGPEGSGLVQLTLSDSGVARAKGKLADGSQVSFSCPLGPLGELGAWSTQRSQWSILGEMALDASGLVAGELQWLRLPAVHPKDKLYNNGFRQSILAHGGLMDPIRRLDYLTDRIGPGNVEMRFSGAGIELARTNPSMPIEISADGRPFLPSPGKAGNPGSLTLVIDPQGLFSGQFVLLDLLPDGRTHRRKVRYEGIITNDTAEGWFLLESLPDGSTEAGKIHAGKIELIPLANPE